MDTTAIIVEQQQQQQQQQHHHPDLVLMSSSSSLNRHSESFVSPASSPSWSLSGSLSSSEHSSSQSSSSSSSSSPAPAVPWSGASVQFDKAPSIPIQTAKNRQHHNKQQKQHKKHKHKQQQQQQQHAKKKTCCKLSVAILLCVVMFVAVGALVNVSTHSIVDMLFTHHSTMLTMLVVSNGQRGRHHWHEATNTTTTTTTTTTLLTTLEYSNSSSNRPLNEGKNDMGLCNRIIPTLFALRLIVTYSIFFVVSANSSNDTTTRTANKADNDTVHVDELPVYSVGEPNTSITNYTENDWFDCCCCLLYKTSSFWTDIK